MAEGFPKMSGSRILQALAPIGSRRTFRKGQGLFQQGEPAHGVYIVQQGQVRIFLLSRAKHSANCELAGPGAVLGLSETVSNRSYRAAAEAHDHTTVSYIERSDLMAFLLDNCDVCMQIVELLSEDLHALYHKFRTLRNSAPHGRSKELRRVN